MAAINSNEKVVFTVTSYHGNLVTLYQEDLDHILLHKEMAGQEAAIKAALQTPTLVREGWDAKSCIFEYPSSTNPEGIRVAVQHTKETFTQGGTEGDVKTAFAVQSGKFTKAFVGAVMPKGRGGV